MNIQYALSMCFLSIYTMTLQNDNSTGHAIQKIIICAKLRGNKATCVISGSRNNLRKFVLQVTKFWVVVSH